MNILEHPINKRWPIKEPKILQLFSLRTPNGVKVNIMLEELNIPYEEHQVNIGDGSQFSEEFLSLNPNNKIPAILDPTEDGGYISLFESGAILLYLAEKYNSLLPQEKSKRYECLQWLFFQIGGVGPMFGQFGFFYKFKGSEITDKRPLERYKQESLRLLGVLDKILKDKIYIANDYSIADIAIFPWVRALQSSYGAKDFLELEEFHNVQRSLQSFLNREAVKKVYNL